jgi:hypothetical protein
MDAGRMGARVPHTASTATGMTISMLTGPTPPFYYSYKKDDTDPWHAQPRKVLI